MMKEAQNKLKNYAKYLGIVNIHCLPDDAPKEIREVAQKFGCT